MGTITYKGKKYDTRHGGPFDRGSMDSYYRRMSQPHYYVGDTKLSDKVEQAQMTDDEVKAYYAGYEYNDELGDYKDWG